MSRSSAARVSPGMPKSTSRFRLATPARRSVATAPRTVSGVARRSSTASSRAPKLWAPSETRAPVPHQDIGERVVDGLGIGLHGDLGCRGQSVEQAIEQRRAEQRGRATADEDRLERYRQQRALAIKLGEQRVNVGTVPVLVPRHRDEVAVAAAMRAEGDVDVEVGDGRHQSPPTWGISARQLAADPQLDEIPSPHRPAASTSR